MPVKSVSWQKKTARDDHGRCRPGEKKPAIKVPAFLSGLARTGASGLGLLAAALHESEHAGGGQQQGGRGWFRYCGDRGRAQGATVDTAVGAAVVALVGAANVDQVAAARIGECVRK